MNFRRHTKVESTVALLGNRTLKFIGKPLLKSCLKITLRQHCLVFLEAFFALGTI